MPSSVVRTFTDPDAYRASNRRMRVEGFVIGRGTFRAESTSVQLDRLSIRRSEETLPRIARYAGDSKIFEIVFVTRRDQQAFVNGIELSHGHVVVVGAGSEGYNRTATACRWGSVFLTHEALASVGQAIIGRELTAPPFTHSIKPPSPLLSRLVNLHEATGHLAKTAPDILAKPEVGRAMEQALMEAMVSCLVCGDPANVHTSHRHHARVMRRLEEAIQANPDEPLYMADLCRALGVSYRILRACCQEHLGMSPKRYLWLRRMNLARRALRRAHPQRTTVTEIAGNYGFWELGRFSVTYRSLFGESPSTTLSRPPEDPQPGETGGSPWQFTKTA